MMMIILFMMKQKARLQKKKYWNFFYRLVIKNVKVVANIAKIFFMELMIKSVNQQMKNK